MIVKQKLPAQHLQSSQEHELEEVSLRRQQRRRGRQEQHRSAGRGILPVATFSSLLLLLFVCVIGLSSFALSTTENDGTGAVATTTTTTTNTTDETSNITETSAAVEGETGTHSAEGESAATAEGHSTTTEESHAEGGGGHHQEPAYAVLFPWFAQTLGIVVFYLLTRYFHNVPYTAVLFVVGMFIGIISHRTTYEDELSMSINMWTNINHEVLFTVFLPGLLFKDALEINFHLFTASFWQLIYFAFPMVLIGTFLTAGIALYIFPYGWNYQLALTFGSILSATDPVAVAALLNEVGAPPRLKMHIGGESLLNDGSAVVFYTVFSGLFFYSIDLEDRGTNFTAIDSFVIFLRMALGGATVGVAFALGLICILYVLDRRLEKEEKVLQVAATVTVAYLSFYVSELVCKMSGVIAVVVCGILTKAFGGGFINDWQIMDSFWSLLEHLLNTLLFTLGGIQFGKIVSGVEGRAWTAQDWGYLILLFILLNIIRFGLMFASYPLTVRIGLSTNWKETFFSSWAGLRGAVGIALALGLDNYVREGTTDEADRDLATKVFGMVGGVAFLTLVVNGTLSGPLLTYLGLADSTDSRKRILQCAEDAAKKRALDDFLHLMTDPRFAFVDFALIKHHVHLLHDLKADELVQAIHSNKNSVHPSLYKQPDLTHVLPYIPDAAKIRLMLQKTQRDAFMSSDLQDSQMLAALEEGATDDDTKASPELVRDIRLMFVELLRASYQGQIDDGELDAREYDGFLAYILLQSLDFAHDSANAGLPLDDWKASQVTNRELVKRIEDFGKRIYRCSCKKKLASDQSSRLLTLQDDTPLQYQQVRLDVLRAFAFIEAHREAQHRLLEEFGKSDGELKQAFHVVLEESKGQVRKAQEVLANKQKKKLKHVISHYLCLILQNKVARYYKHLFDSGVLLQREARHLLEEVEESIGHIRACRMDKHPGSIDYVDTSETSEITARPRLRKKQKSIL